jgi:hypothetical protein
METFVQNLASDVPFIYQVSGGPGASGCFKGLSFAAGGSKGSADCAVPYKQ